MLEAFSYVVRMFSGVISDRMTSRKAAITAGFVMGAAAKFGMSFATSTVQLFMTKAVDRLGNGVQVSRPVCMHSGIACCPYEENAQLSLHLMKLSCAAACLHVSMVWEGIAATSAGLSPSCNRSAVFPCRLHRVTR
jgi:hypothetical protein